MFYDGHQNTAGGADAKQRPRVHRDIVDRRAVRSCVRAATRGGRSLQGALIGALDEEGVGALLRLFEDARDVLQRGGRAPAHGQLLDALLAAFAERRETAWSHIFHALARIEACASDSMAPSLRRIRGFLQENADLADTVPNRARFATDGG